MTVAPLTPSPPPPLVWKTRRLRGIGYRPWWLYDADDFPGRTAAQIEAGLTVPACDEVTQ